MPYVGRGLTTGAQYQKLDDIAINNATTFTMQVSSANVTPDQNHLILVVNGVIQEPGTGFTVAGSTCTLASAITTSGHSGTDTIYGVIAGDAAFAAYDSIGVNALGVTAGTVTASRAVVPDSNKDIASFRNVTLTGELDSATLDVSGNADIDGTTNLDAVDIDGAVQIDATFTSGVDGQGYDTKLFGDTSGAYIMWDTSADDLIFVGAAGLDIAGDIDVDGTANLDIVDIDGAVNMAADLTSTANIIIDADDKGLILGADQDTTIFSDAAGKVKVARGSTTSIGSTEGMVVIEVRDGGATELLLQGGEAGEAEIYLYPDQSDDNDDRFRIQGTTGGNLNFDSYSTGSWVSGITYDGSAGNVGIGQDDPDTELSVEGQFTIQEVTGAGMVSAFKNVSVTGGSATTVFTITHTAGEVYWSAHFKGFAMIGNPAGAMGYECVAVYAQDPGGTEDAVAISETVETSHASWNAGAGNISGIVATLVNTSATVQELKFNVSLGGSSPSGPRVVGVLDLVYYDDGNDNAVVIT